MKKALPVLPAGPFDKNDEKTENKITLKPNLHIK